MLFSVVSGIDFLVNNSKTASVVVAVLHVMTEACWRQKSLPSPLLCLLLIFPTLSLNDWK